MKRMPAFFRFILAAALLTVSYAGSAHAAEELIVSAAASLTNAFGEIATKFEAANPGVKVVTNFGASGALLQQIDKGAPVDVFATADQKTMNDAAEKKLIDPGTRKDFARNGLALVVPRGNAAKVASLKDLARKEITRIAVGNPQTVPAGRYAKEALTHEGLWDELTPRYVLGESVRQVLDYVSRGEVDAGFVFTSDAAAAKGKVEVAAGVGNHSPILYPIAGVASAEKKALARKYIDYVLSAEGMAVLAGFGFEKP
ncbi:MAG: molybdate ABC transporter substrate-binding protein [Syntrophobacteraceae bacterium]